MQVAAHEKEKLNRIISIRISDAEFQELQKVTRSSGAKSIADVARYSIQQVLNKCNEDSAHTVAIFMYLLHQDVQDLSSQLKTVSEQVTQFSRGNSSPRKARGAAKSNNQDAQGQLRHLAVGAGSY